MKITLRLPPLVVASTILAEIPPGSHEMRRLQELRTSYGTALQEEVGATHRTTQADLKGKYLMLEGSNQIDTRMINRLVERGE